MSIKGIITNIFKWLYYSYGFAILPIGFALLSGTFIHTGMLLSVNIISYDNISIINTLPISIDFSYIIGFSFGFLIWFMRSVWVIVD